MLPELDIAPFLRAPGSPRSLRFVSELREACHGPGFCYLRGHGVAEPLERELFATAAAFFALPLEDREALAIERSAHFRGYTR
jgi:isopenicillin N synthase-like dioxygenase